MKGMKKILAGMMAAALIMGSSMTAFATEGTTEIVINHSDEYGDQEQTVAQKYTYYKVLSADIAENGDGKTDLDGTQTGVKAAYYVEDEALVNTLSSVFKFSAQASNGRFYVTGIAENKEGATLSATEIADALEALAKAGKFGNGTTAELKPLTDAEGNLVDADGNSVDKPVWKDSTSISVPADGYYVMISELGSVAVIQTVGEKKIEIAEKNDYPHIDKTQKDTVEHAKENPIDEGKDANDAVIMQVGDVVEYTLTVDVPAKTSKEITVVDTMTQGLDYDAATLSITGFGSDKATSSYDATNRKLTVVLPENTGDATSTTITFSCTINKNAIVDVEGRKNDVELIYGNYHEYDSVPYEVSRTGAYKYDGATLDALDGVEFKLSVAVGTNAKTELKVSPEYKVDKDEEGNEIKTLLYYYPDENGSSTVVTDAEGFIIVRGLDVEKKYYLTETTPKAGYNGLIGDVTLPVVSDTEDAAYRPTITKGENENGEAIVSVTEKDEVAELSLIPNMKGIELPSTGGIGTTIFYLIGGLLIVSAAVFFVVRRKAE